MGRTDASANLYSDPWFWSCSPPEATRPRQTVAEQSVVSMRTFLSRVNLRREESAAAAFFFFFFFVFATAIANGIRREKI